MYVLKVAKKVVTIGPVSRNYLSPKTYRYTSRSFITVNTSLDEAERHVGVTSRQASYLFEF